MFSRDPPRPAPVAERRTCKIAVYFFSCQPAHPIYYRRFHIGSDGILTITVPPRQAIALHTGAQGMGLPALEPIRQVTVLFSETATTTLGEVSWPFIDLGVELRRR